jgi:Darcynin, domain of unknown function
MSKSSHNFDVATPQLLQPTSESRIMTKPFTIFMLVKTTATWLLLSPSARFAFLDDVIKPILAKHADVSLRFFDVEAFNARATDVLMWQAADLTRFQSLVEHLRETRFWTTYFEVLEILPGVEDAYADHYGVASVQTGSAA